MVMEILGNAIDSLVGNVVDLNDDNKANRHVAYHALLGVAAGGAFFGMVQKQVFLGNKWD